MRHVIGAICLALLFAGLSWPQPRSQAFRFLPCYYLGLFCVRVTVHGSCGIPGVKEAFQKNFDTMMETNSAQLAILQSGLLTCSLWAGRDETITSDSLQVVFSTSKVVVSLATAMLVDRGLLEYDAPVSSYWPLFGQNGKENLTIRDVLQHRAGLAWADDGDDLSDDVIPVFFPNKNNLTARQVFEKSYASFPSKESTTGYHGMTRSLILNELFLLVDGRSVSDFIDKEISDKIGAAFFVGTQHPVVDHIGVSVGWAIVHLCKMGWNFAWGSLPTEPQNIHGLLQEYLEKGREMPLLKLSESVGLQWHAVLDHHNTADARSRESPSSNAVSNARSMALIASVFLGHYPEILSEKARQEALTLEPASVYDYITHSRVHFSRNGLMAFKGPDWNNLDGWTGGHGLGGQLLLINQERDMSLSYLTTGFGLDAPWQDERSQRILEQIK